MDQDQIRKAYEKHGWFVTEHEDKLIFEKNGYNPRFLYISDLAKIKDELKLLFKMIEGLNCVKVSDETTKKFEIEKLKNIMDRYKLIQQSFDISP